MMFYSSYDYYLYKYSLKFQFSSIFLSVSHVRVYNAWIMYICFYAFYVSDKWTIIVLLYYLLFLRYFYVSVESRGSAKKYANIFVLTAWHPDPGLYRNYIKKYISILCSVGRCVATWESPHMSSTHISNSSSPASPHFPSYPPTPPPVPPPLSHLFPS